MHLGLIITIHVMHLEVHISTNTAQLNYIINVSFLLVVQLHQNDLEHLDCRPILENPKKDGHKQIEKVRLYQHVGSVSMCVYALLSATYSLAFLSSHSQTTAWLTWWPLWSSGALTTR